MDIFAFKKRLQDTLSSDYEDYRIVEALGDAIEQLIKEDVHHYDISTALLHAAGNLITDEGDFREMRDFKSYFDRQAQLYAEFVTNGVPKE